MGSDLAFRYGLDMVTIDSTIPRHAILFGKEYLTGNIADGESDRGDSNFSKIFQD